MHAALSPLTAIEGFGSVSPSTLGSLTLTRTSVILFHKKCEFIRSIHAFAVSLGKKA